MSCRECSGVGGLGYQIRVSDVRHLYSPSYTVSGYNAFKKPATCTRIKCRMMGGVGDKCKTVCQMLPPTGDKYKSYAFKGCDVPLIRSYEEQPWFRNRVVQENWHEFVDQLVTPANIGAKLCPGPDDWQFKCHKARALIGPTVECVWDLPDQDPCATTSYGYNRDWRRYNEDQRMAATDMECGCNDEPMCKPLAAGSNRTGDSPPYLGKKLGARYMAWGKPTTFMYPLTRPYNWQSRPKC